MKQHVFSIFDTASALYSRPFFEQSDATAQRQFMDIATDEEHPVGRHPKDYALMRVGTWNDVTGKLEDSVNECVCTGLEAVAHSKQYDGQAQLGVDPTLPYGGNQAN